MNIIKNVLPQSMCGAFCSNFLKLKQSLVHLDRGACKLTRDNLKLVWAEFSALSSAVLMKSLYSFTWTPARIYSYKLGPGLDLLA
jgi:hypothetical protein